MRLVAALLFCIIASSCGGPPVHPWWREMTAEEKERERSYEQSQRERIRKQHGAKEERRQRALAVVQAFSLQDVKGCARLGLVSYETLDGARYKAVDLDGDRILPQRNHAYPRVERRAVYDDYEVYRCEAPSPGK